jgi:HD-GYP domain-containing protein (c-di-GMP phosphodiesterase class II)
VFKFATASFHYGWLIVTNKLSGDRSLAATDEYSQDYIDPFNACEFGTYEAGLATTAASALATYARNSSLFNDYKELLTGTIRSLVNAIDAKDSYTCGHSDRVALLARRLAAAINFDSQQCHRIYMSGLLHDVGKIGVPDEVLNKAGKLTEVEFDQIKQHPVIGHEILRHVKNLSYVLPGVLHHHESIDGRGYPHGLKGDDIPLEARIIAVADAYDAMTSDRAYRAGMPTEKAEAILREGAGQQWDARIIAAFFASIDDIQAICDKDREHRNPEAMLDTAEM